MAESYREFRHPIVVLVLTIATAGVLDSFAFLRYGAFVANQSGNAVFLGIGPAGEHPRWPASAASLVAFAAGAGIVSRLREVTRRWSPPVVNVVAVELAMSLWVVLNVLLAYGRHGAGSRVVLAATGAFAMGSLTTLLSRTAGIATTITYQSGTTAKTGEHAVRWLVDRGAGRARARLGTLLGLLGISSYAAGGAIGTLAQRQPRWVPLWGALALAVLIFLIRRDDDRS
ncbi:YoaK family protein [Micromonospora sp. NPDC004336]